MSEEALQIPAVEIAFRTDPGRDPTKQVNEDSAAHVETPLGLLAVVCDGMGGHASGKEASELAVKTIVELVQAAPETAAPRDALRVAIEEANRRVWSMPPTESGQRPGSTVVVVLIHAGGAEIAHVGDSRIYFVHAGVALQITKDHSMVQAMVDHNVLRPEDAANHPDANKILRALGIAKDVDVEFRSDPVAFVAGDVFVLCSDGLSDLVGPGEILDIAGSKPAQQAAGQLVDLANARGGHDNITAMVVRTKASVAAHAAPTLLKTVPLTALDSPADSNAGGTLLADHAMPASAPTAGLPPSSPSDARRIPTVRAMPARPRGVAQASPRWAQSARVPSRAPVVLGIALGIAAFAIGGAFLWVMHRPPSHVTVPIVDAQTPSRHTAHDAAPENSDATAPNGEPRACTLARWAKKAGKPPADVAAFENQCRAAGGTL
ncbi:MAG: protein phosphatase 2C domain-containing protein [Polyangiaceae bacterium]|nr:protein phosphatase 2C domain-containing protein [Polyangiaceae bacterium]